ncbi:MAG TPA: MoaD/ThiS family protein [Chloroflexota bacterium]|nr:MoaD/ThiS family protein [Chloroflexota bacterium]
MKIDLRIVALPVEGRAKVASDPVAQQTCPPLPVELPVSSRVEDLIRMAAELGAWTYELHEVLLNGQAVSWATPLHDGDAVTLLGPIGTP